MNKKEEKETEPSNDDTDVNSEPVILFNDHASEELILQENYGDNDELQNNSFLSEINYDEACESNTADFFTEKRGLKINENNHPGNISRANGIYKCLSPTLTYFI